MVKLTKTTIKEQVYEIIKDKILTQQYHLGEKVNIDTLAAELNVSNSPIREALTMLEKHGLVEIIPNNGARVISFDPVTYHEIASTLHIMVSGAYNLCLRQNTVAEAIPEMRKYWAIQQEYANSGDLHASVKSALMFDKSIVLAAKNNYLLSIYEQIEDVFFLMALDIHQRGEHDRAQNIFEHSMILKSIESGDSAAALHWLDIHYDKHL